MALKWPCACSTSASAAVRNRCATFGIPSCSALRANARYFWLAWLSPANASLRFVLVLIVFPLVPSETTSLSGLHIRKRDPRGIRLRLVHPSAARTGELRSPGKLKACPTHRSEEHTSELQSPMYLVCRLLLE